MSISIFVTLLRASLRLLTKPRDACSTFTILATNNVLYGSVVARSFSCGFPANVYVDFAQRGGRTCAHELTHCDALLYPIRL